MKFLLLAAALVVCSSCASTRQGAAMQQTAIGGGLVGVGVAGGVAAAAGGIGLMATASQLPKAATEQFALSVGAAAAFDIVAITAGVIVMKLAEDDLVASATLAPARRVARSQDDDFVRARKIEARPASNEPVFWPASERLDVARSRQGALVRPAEGTIDLAGCRYAKMVVDGRDWLMPGDDSGGFRAAIDPAALKTAKTVAIDFCGPRLELAPTELAALQAAVESGAE